MNEMFGRATNCAVNLFSSVQHLLMNCLFLCLLCDDFSERSRSGDHRSTTELSYKSANIAVHIAVNFYHDGRDPTMYWEKRENKLIQGKI